MADQQSPSSGAKPRSRKGLLFRLCKSLICREWKSTVCPSWKEYLLGASTGSAARLARDGRINRIRLGSALLL